MRVTYRPRGQRAVVYTYPGTYDARVLASGVLKIYAPGEIDVPAMGEDTVAKEIAVQKEYVVAIFNGEYNIQWESVDDV